MAQAILLSSYGGRLVVSGREPLLRTQIHGLHPPPISHLFRTARPSSLQPNSASSRSFTPLATFKSKTKAPIKKVEKAKSKIEDGVFGTSGGIGFTKQNELFVGRVAMIGFAILRQELTKMPPSKYIKEPPLEPGDSEPSSTRARAKEKTPFGKRARRQPSSTRARAKEKTPLGELASSAQEGNHAPAETSPAASKELFRRLHSKSARSEESATRAKAPPSHKVSEIVPKALHKGTR